ncbi:MAG: OsmC family protein [Halobacteriales archaeon]|nr:OsmC family protein [Halobacteriales archaeon]
MPGAIPMVKRTASAQWQGGLKDGKGTVSTESKVLSNTRYSFAQRFEAEHGTNPEELIAAAHASCFTMAFSGDLGRAGLNPASLETTATLTFEKVGDKFTVTEIHLDTRGKVPGATPQQFEKAAQDAKANCPISRLLAPGTRITLSAKLA